MTYQTNNPVGSVDVRDLYDNAKNLDNFSNGPLDAYPDRFGVPRQSLQGIRNASQYVDLGPYAAGLNFTSRNQVFSYLGEFYAPGPAITLPYTTTGVGAAEIANFRSVGDAVLRSELNDQVDPAKGSGLLGFIAATGAASRTLLSKLNDFVVRADYTSDAAFNAAKAGKLSRDSTERLRSKLFIAGTEEVSGATVRDAFVVGRSVTGLTDCHAFADRTILSGVTDAGTYGVFDATTELQGSNAQNHVYGFQDRIKYSGSGSINEQAGFLSVPVHAGTGAMTNRYGADIRDVSLTGGGTLGANIGVFIRDLINGTNKAALNIQQTTGNAIYAPGAGKNYFAGDTGIGPAQNESGVPLTVTGSALSPQWYAGSSAGAVQTGAIGDFTYQVINGGRVRLELMNAAGSRALRPGADNSQPLGDVTKRWSTVYAGTGAINTSDAREKCQQRSQSEAEKAAAIELKSKLMAFKWKASVDSKGDDARWHFGIMAQDVGRVFAAHGLDAEQYGMFCYDEWPEQPEVVADGVVVTNYKPAGNRYGVRHDQLFAFILAAL